MKIMGWLLVGSVVVFSIQFCLRTVLSLLHLCIGVHKLHPGSPLQMLNDTYPEMQPPQHVCDATSKPTLQHCMQAPICSPIAGATGQRAIVHLTFLSHFPYNQSVRLYGQSDSPLETLSSTRFREVNTYGWVSFTLGELDYCTRFVTEHCCFNEGQNTLPYTEKCSPASQLSVTVLFHFWTFFLYTVSCIFSSVHAVMDSI